MGAAANECHAAWDEASTVGLVASAVLVVAAVVVAVVVVVVAVAVAVLAAVAVVAFLAYSHLESVPNSLACREIAEYWPAGCAVEVCAADTLLSSFYRVSRCQCLSVVVVE